MHGGAGGREEDGGGETVAKIKIELIDKRTNVLHNIKIERGSIFIFKKRE